MAREKTHTKRKYIKQSSLLKQLKKIKAAKTKKEKIPGYLKISAKRIICDAKFARTIANVEKSPKNSPHFGKYNYEKLFKTIELNLLQTERNNADCTIASPYKNIFTSEGYYSLPNSLESLVFPPDMHGNTHRSTSILSMYDVSSAESVHNSTPDCSLNTSGSYATFKNNSNSEKNTLFYECKDSLTNNIPSSDTFLLQNSVPNQMDSSSEKGELSSSSESVQAWNTESCASCGMAMRRLKNNTNNLVEGFYNKNDSSNDSLLLLSLLADRMQ
ncbi:hypothetical protein NEMIN01_0842 [Nematocida minor]|uniref:uncharacterized protein n=1 Tax=Nematocida minor TaxID=1912983 RepID=UPI002220B518|nr:uncharacterized protein NEMIN01_0842 [Nematocida minor]KAI5190057.1 hypothetical protein NEMIN01_0842 [Nematocida minor]